MAWKNINTAVVISNPDFDKQISGSDKGNWKSGHWEPTHMAVLVDDRILFASIIPPPPNVMDPTMIM